MLAKFTALLQQTVSCANNAKSLGTLSELQKRANRANQLVLFFLAGANFWEKHAKNCAILCIFCVFFGANFFWGGKLGGANFYAFCNHDLH